MATIDVRLKRLEDVESLRAGSDLAQWVRESASDDERAAWDRVLLNYPFSDADKAWMLRRAGVTAEERDVIFAQVGPVRAGDYDVVDAMLARVPGELRVRLGLGESA